MNTEETDREIETKPRPLSPRARQATEEILERWQIRETAVPLDRFVGGEFRARRFLNAGERRGISEIVYGTVRYLRRQQALRDALGLPDTPAALAALAPLLPSPPEAPLQPEIAALPLPEGISPESADHALAALPGPDAPRDYLRVTLSFSDAMAEALEALNGPTQAAQAGAALNAQAPTTLRVNPLQTTRESILRQIPDSTPTRYSPLGLELPRRINLHELPGFREGAFEIQEESSQLAVLLADPKPGQTVVEVGAGGGGKTLLLAALMQNQGAITAIDTSQARLEELQKRAERAGATNVALLPMVANEVGVWVPSKKAGRELLRLNRAADLVFVDAPCSGSGVLRRSPDIKWRNADLNRFARLQEMILMQASDLVAPGGTLIYVTCAFEREQNEAVVDAFLASERGPNWEIVPALPRLADALRRAGSLAPIQTNAGRKSKPGGANAEPNSGAGREEEPAVAPNESLLADLASGPFLRFWPHRHGLDAYFAACLRRKND